jgi:hypothetical protein
MYPLMQVVQSRSFVSENIHLQPYSTEEEFYARIYPKYLALLDKAKVYMDETEADPEKTVIFIRRVTVSALSTPLESELLLKR